MKNTKKILSVFLALMMVISIIPMSTITASAADSGTFGKLTWSFDNSTGTLTISGASSMIEYESYIHYPWQSNCTKIKKIVIKDNVTSIAGYAFYNYDNLTSVTLGSGITSIGYRAFSNCDKLTSITIPSRVKSIGEEAFYSCKGLTSVSIPNSVTSIDDYAFSNCKSLKSVTIPASVVSIGNSSFSGCECLASIKVNSSSKHYSNDECGVLFNKNKTTLVQYPAGRTETNYTIPDGVSLIGWGAFDSCKNLTDITMPDSVTLIKFGAFQRCINLSKLTLSNNLVSIENAAFSACTSLKNITIPDSVTSIGGFAFSDCKSLESITIPEGITSIRGNTFYNCISLSSIIIPESVTSIGDMAFCWCDKLTDVYYGGSQSQWNKITISSNNQPLLDANIHYNFSGHLCSFGEWTVTVKPTCTKEGTKTRSCSKCDETETESIPANGHNMVNGSCSVCGILAGYDSEINIQVPSTTTIRNKDGIILHANINGTPPTGSYVVWTSNNENFDKDAGGNNLTVIAEDKGWTTFTATLYDSKGTVISTDSIELYSKSGFFDKIGGFFRSLFGSTKIYEN